LGISFAFINQKVGSSHLYYNNAAGFFYQQAVKDAGFEEEFKKTFELSKQKAGRFGAIERISSKVNFYFIWPVLNLLVAVVAAALVVAH
jgi:hypothetical protein